jgi:hypothetical protein
MGRTVLQHLIVLADDAGLVLRVTAQGRNTAGSDPRRDPANHFADAAGTGTGDWTWYKVTAQIPADAGLVLVGSQSWQVGFRVV